MSRVLSGIGKVAGVVAAVAMVIPGGQPIAAIASLVALTANVGAAVTAKKPPARGSTSQVMIGANMPMPYTMGRTYVGGSRVHDAGYGGTVNKVVNPYRSMVDIYSVAGPIDSIEGTYSDFTLITFSSGNAAGYYNNFMYRSTQLGASPEGSALAGPFGSIPNWGAPYNLSGFAAALYSLKYDKDGKKYSSGVPQLGAVIKGVKVYDPRLDTTYPGGSGAHRFATESTWAWSENPALHALAYARGRYQNGKKVIGCGFAEAGIDIAAFVELANICDANGWALGGTIYEPGSKWDNLKRILAASAAEPVFVGARLSVRFNTPRIALDTITAADLADGEYVVPAMKTWRDRLNGIIPRYRSETHKWEYVQSDLVTVSGYVTEDGEEKQEERQYDLVQDKDQAAQLAAYDLVNGREFGPIVLHLKPRFIEYVPGEALEGGADLAELGIAGQLMIITGRTIDPATCMVTLTLESETTAKHAFALGLTGTAPPTPTITSGEDMDDLVTENMLTTRDVALLIGQSSTSPTRVLTASESGGVAEITVLAHDRVYPDGTIVPIGSQVFGGLVTNTPYFPYYDDLSLADTTPTIIMTTDSSAAQGLPGAHSLGRIRTPITASGITYEGGGAYMPGATVGREVDGPTP